MYGATKTDVEDWAFASAGQMAKAIKSRSVSSRELTEAYLSRIVEHNSSLNAVVTVNEEEVLARASEADESVAQGAIWGPLHGVPFTLEDCHKTQGVRSTWGGLPSLADFIPDCDGSVALRLKAAGAILIGKTHGPTVWEDESIFPRTNNPWDAKRSPGGSSSGPACAVAAGLTAFDVGLDSTGSIQEPAHLCGIFGMRPTEHRVSLADVFFLDPIRKFHVLTVPGPMARSVEDLRLILEIIQGPDGADSEVPPVPWSDALPVELGDLRVATLPASAGIEVQEEIGTALDALTEELGARGAQVTPCLPDVDLGDHVRLGDELFDSIARAFESEEPYESPIRKEDNPPSTLDTYLRHLDRRDSLFAKWDNFFSEWDVLLLAAGPTTAWLHPSEDTPAPDDPDLNAVLSPVTGCPAIMLPLGVDNQGLPFGVELMGRRWGDERLLDIAASVVTLTDGFRRPAAL